MAESKPSPSTTDRDTAMTGLLKARCHKEVEIMVDKLAERRGETVADYIRRAVGRQVKEDMDPILD